MASGSIREAPQSEMHLLAMGAGQCATDKVRGPDRLVAGFATARNSSRLRPLSQRGTWVQTNADNRESKEGTAQSFYKGRLQASVL